MNYRTARNRPQDKTINFKLISVSPWTSRATADLMLPYQGNWLRSHFNPGRSNTRSCAFRKECMLKPLTPSHQSTAPATSISKITNVDTAAEVPTQNGDRCEWHCWHCGRVLCRPNKLSKRATTNPLDYSRFLADMQRALICHSALSSVDVSNTWHQHSPWWCTLRRKRQ